MKALIVAAAAVALTACAAQARPHADGSGSITQFCGDRVCWFQAPREPRKVLQRTAGRKTTRSARVRATHILRHPAQDRVKRSARYDRPQIVRHPPGCPATAFCGCGVSIHVFGRSIRDLWLARNWFRFPPAAAAPGMVAVRRGHVFAILKVISGGLVLAFDPNSGGHLTRIHVRALAGFSVRNPHGRRYAVLR